MATVLKEAPSMGPLMAKAALGMTPLRAGARGKEIPEIDLQLPGIKVDLSHLADYCHVCAFPLRNTLPSTYPHMQAFPLQMAAMTDPKFPFPAVGMVHIVNKITQHRPIGVDEQYDMRVTATQLEAHPKGRKFTFVSQASIDGELVWEDFSTYLRRGGGDGDAAEPAGNGVDPVAKAADDELPATAEWRLPSGLGRQYGAVSGDRNPIHMYNITAKALGFPRAIAHGMWTKARCVAALDGLLADAHTVDVSFKLPILLPAKVEFGLREESDRLVFGVRDARKGKPHLAGVATAD